MEHKPNKFKGRIKETKKEYTRRWQLRDKIRRQEDTEWKQLRVSILKECVQKCHLKQNIPPELKIQTTL